MKDKVLFYKDHDGEHFAVFPNIPWNKRGDVTCYQHIGQHGACDLTWIEDEGYKQVDPSQCPGLVRELLSIGYSIDNKP